MRLFVSCEVSEEISNYIHELSKRLPDAKLVVPKNIDLTIKFLGDVQDNKLEEIKQKLSEIKFKSFKAMLNGVGVFTEDFIRVVWVGLSPSEQFEELHVLTDAALKGLFPEEKRFQAHVTIARIKYVSDKNKFLEEIKKIKVEPLTFEVNKLVLVRSQLSPNGATHESLMEIKAQGL